MYETDFLCPDCGSYLIERTSHKTGNSFFGCAAYPSCVKTLPIWTRFTEDGEAIPRFYVDGDENPS